MRRVRKDDRVKVIAGKDRGKEGRIVKVLTDRDKVIVEGVNYVKKHKRLQQTATGVQEGGIIETEAPIHISNVMPICPSCGEATRVGYVRDGDKLSKARSCKSCDATF